MLSGQPNHISEYANGGIISDQRILLKGWLEARLVVFKDYVSGKVLRFVSNLFDYDVMTIVQLYKYRWNIEVLFKQLKQNFELCYFFFPCQSKGFLPMPKASLPQRDAFGMGKGCPSQSKGLLWRESFGLALEDARGMEKSEERNLEIVQMQLFRLKGEGTFQKHQKNTPNTS